MTDLEKLEEADRILARSFINVEEEDEEVEDDE